MAHEYPTAGGTTERVWTTFSADQVDLDYRNPRCWWRWSRCSPATSHHGARAIRLDAVAFVWKDPARPSVHLPETHAVVQLFRCCLDEIAPDVAADHGDQRAPRRERLVPRDDVDPEADAVYQFALPPLVLHTMLTGDSHPLVEWAAALEFPAGHRTFLNFLASHDGIGLRPAEDVLDESAIARLAAAAVAAGGVVNHRTDGAAASRRTSWRWPGSS